MADVAGYAFTDPITDRVVGLKVGIGIDRMRPGLPGMVVVHGDCPTPADVSPDLDCFYCPTCGWNGRISGQWAMDMLARLDAP